jgi:mono/diheme cytochrome c family protein
VQTLSPGFELALLKQAASLDAGVRKNPRPQRGPFGVLGVFDEAQSLPLIHEATRNVAPQVRWGRKKMRSLNRSLIGMLAIAFGCTGFIFSTAAQTDTLKFSDAASYYKDAKCNVCHGPKAEKKFDAELKDDELVQIILKGKKPEKPPNMPSYEAKGLTADQAKTLVDYMRALKKEQ